MNIFHYNYAISYSISIKINRQVHTELFIDGGIIATHNYMGDLNQSKLNYRVLNNIIFFRNKSIKFKQKMFNECRKKHEITTLLEVDKFTMNCKLQQQFLTSITKTIKYAKLFFWFWRFTTIGLGRGGRVVVIPVFCLVVIEECLRQHYRILLSCHTPRPMMIFNYQIFSPCCRAC